MSVQEPEGIKGFHLVRYGTPADQKFLLGPFLSTYDQLVINATMVAHAPAALASFLTQRARNKPYFIDPQTHAFQHDVGYLESSSDRSSGEIKRSISKLIEAYGEPVKTRVGLRRKSLLPRDLSDGGLRKDFCAHVFDFQMRALADEATTSDAAKYYAFLRKNEVSRRETFLPSLVVAPYFYMASNTLDPWLKVNLNCAEDTLQLAAKDGVPVGVQIVLSRDILHNLPLVHHLVSEYTSRVQPAVFLLWVDRFPEHAGTADELNAFVTLLNGVGSHAAVVNLYGGFFSVTLGRSGIVKNLVGVAHGLEYSEDRAVVPVGGGIPIAKFYFPSLHVRLPFRDAFRAARALGPFRSADTFHRKVCDCKECKEVIGSIPLEDFGKYGKTKSVFFERRGQPTVMDYPLPETKAHCVRHYMWCKDREYKTSSQSRQVATELKQTGRLLEPIVGLESVAHCDTWATVLLRKPPVS